MNHNKLRKHLLYFRYLNFALGLVASSLRPWRIPPRLLELS